MNYTEKYHLPQWVESDRILMTDFNQMCADIEAGITAAKAAADSAGTTASRAEGKADSAGSAASAAQSTANTALTKASNAYSPDNLYFASGQYAGTGKYGSANPTVINVGFRPRVLIITCSSYNELTMGGLFIYPATSYGAPENFQWTATGATFWNNTYAASQLNASGYTYTWFALK